MEPMEDTIQRLKDCLKRDGLKAVVIPHISADGDAAGACSAFYGALSKKGMNCHILTCDHFPEYLRWLKNIDRTISFQNKPEKCRELIEEADLIFMLDHNTVKREGDLEPWVTAAEGKKIIIDHHPDPDSMDFVISDVRVSSTCELLYRVITEIWGSETVDTDIANALYAGINTDTGGLSHNSSRPQTYRVIADLLERGLDKEFVHHYLYQTNKLSRLRLIGNALLNKLTMLPGYPVALIPITLKELERYNYRDGDLEGLVNVPLSVEKICVSVQITQRKEQVKLSFRSKGAIPVNEWAKAFFNGGGHLNAAGGQTELPLEQAVERVKETVGWFFEKYVNRSTESL